MTVERILREAGLASRIQQILDGFPARDSALAALGRVRAQLFGEAVYKWAFVAEPVPLLAEAPKVWRVILPLAWSALRTFLWPLLVLPALLLVGRGLRAAAMALGAEIALVAIAGGIAYARFRRQEDRDVPDDRNAGALAVGEIMARENKRVQNHLAAVSPLKPGWRRRLTLRFALWAVGAFAAHNSRPGFLSSIGSIHFARWILLPGTSKLLFFSNYTGSWESYLEIFIARLAYGLTAIWSNTQGFPRTKNLLQDGARDGDRFKRWARRQQHPTRFWYAAYPDLTAERIRINAAIRHGFATASTDADAARWLVHFRFVESTLESDGIPTLVFGGLSGLPHARSLVLRLPDVPRDARAWLAAIEPDIGYGERRRAGPTLALGLSESGLRKLGLDPQNLSSFPAAFQHGMAAPWRARVLGDVGHNAPDRWWWGGPGNPADAILNLYAPSAHILQHEVGQRTAQLLGFGGQVIHQILMDTLPPGHGPVREPFGFADGISQPIVRGTRRWASAGSRIHDVAPGEMILGYPDNSGYVPASPSAAGRDLGRNGTYLVVRQLEQDTTAFDKCLRQVAHGLLGDPRVPAGDAQWLSGWLAAKMVGRWPDGTSLARHPDRPGSTEPDNDFLLGVEDPDGLRCPIGAHIRRVNSRAGLDPKSDEIANRHRILRVGRAYSPQTASPNPGLLFMCVNANIERQFEFLQTWMLAPSFGGLEGEIDSFARRPGLSDVLTIPTARGPLRLQGLGNFVTVRGGGYFFMPGRSTVSFLAR
jgi:hypothetical protein